MIDTRLIIELEKLFAKEPFDIGRDVITITNNYGRIEVSEGDTPAEYEDTISNLEYEVSAKDFEIDTLEDEVEDLKDKISELEEDQE